MVVKEINRKETSGSGGRNTSQFSFRMMEVVSGWNLWARSNISCCIKQAPTYRLLSTMPDIFIHPFQYSRWLHAVNILIPCP